MYEVPREIAVQVQQARNEKKLSQDQLAKKISEPLAKIQALEKCEGVYDPKLVVKIEKALNVHQIMEKINTVIKNISNNFSIHFLYNFIITFKTKTFQ